MPLPVFDFRVDANNAVRTNTYRTKSVQFGDGYKQLAPAGINNKLDTWDLTLPLLTDAVVIQVEAFFDVLGQHKNFSWTPPRGTSGVYRVTSPIKYQAQGLDRFGATRTTVVLSIEKVYIDVLTSQLVSLNIIEPSINEDGVTSLVFVFARSNASLLLPLIINFTVAGTATFGVDYTAIGASTFTQNTGSVIIPSGSSSANVICNPIADTMIEQNETIFLSIIPRADIELGTSSSAVGTILTDDNDPYFASVILLLKPNGIDNSNVFIDNSLYSRPINTIGNTKILSNKAIFDGSGDYLSIPSAANLDMSGQDFTIELLFTTTQTNQYSTLASRGTASFSSGSWSIMNSGSGANGRVQVWAASYSTSGPILSAPLTTSDNIQHHLVWEKSGSLHSLYIDGISIASFTTSISMPTIFAPIIVGGDGNFPRDYLGNIEIFRYTKGVARYQGNFTVPTQFLSF